METSTEAKHDGNTSGATKMACKDIDRVPQSVVLVSTQWDTLRQTDLLDEPHCLYSLNLLVSGEVDASAERMGGEKGRRRTCEKY